MLWVAGKPYIIAVHPSEGWITGGTKVCIVGMNFYEGVEVVFGTLPATSEVLALLCMSMSNTAVPRHSLLFAFLGAPYNSLTGVFFFVVVMTMPLSN